MKFYSAVVIGVDLLDDHIDVLLGSGEVELLHYGVQLLNVRRGSTLAVIRPSPSTSNNLNASLNYYNCSGLSFAVIKKY